MASLPKAATRILKQWLIDHFNDPYPSGEEKVALATFSGLTPNQVSKSTLDYSTNFHRYVSIIDLNYWYKVLHQETET